MVLNITKDFSQPQRYRSYISFFRQTWWLHSHGTRRGWCKTVHCLNGSQHSTNRKTYAHLQNGLIIA